MRPVVRGAAAATVLALGTVAWAPYGEAAPAAAGQVDLGGEPVDGSDSPSAPTELGPGLWSTTLGSFDEYFTYTRRIKDSTVHIGVAGVPQSADSDGLDIATTVEASDYPEGLDCGTDSDSSDSYVPGAVFGIAVVVGDEDGTDGTTCRGADEVHILLGRNDTSATSDLPVAIKIVEEAPVADPGPPSEEGEEISFVVPERVDGTTSQAGASSFADAPLVDPHDGVVTIDADVAEGTELLWRVPVEWGDQLVARADLAALPDKEAERLGSPTAYVRLRIVQPGREVMDWTIDGETSDGSYGGNEETRLTAGSFPLRYSNRFADVTPVLPGDHWVSVAVATNTEERAPVDVPVALTLAVTQPDDDAEPPTYQDAVLAQDGGNGPGGYSPETPYLVGDGEFSAVASGDPVASDSDEDGWWGPRHVAGLGVGVLSLACCAIGAAWLVRRRAMR